MVWKFIKPSKGTIFKFSGYYLEGFLKKFNISVYLKVKINLSPLF
jgi:hypothetical protein